ncbi:hypothetical protein ACXM1Q_004270 [Streptococcus sp. 10F2]
MDRCTRRHFSDEFKQQIVDLYQAGKRRSEIIGQSFGGQKSTELFKEAIQSIPYS